jgi:hypothetical protein
MNNTTTITIDLAKDVFQVPFFCKYGKAMISKAISPKELRQFAGRFPEAVIFMVVCGCYSTWGNNSKSSGCNVGTA